MYTHAGTRRVDRVLKYSDLIKLYIKQKGKCALSGIVFDEETNKPSIDRINLISDHFKWRNASF